MGLIDEIRLKGAEVRLSEEIIYGEALREMESGIRRDGLWAKALSEAGGAEGAAKARYIKLRVQALRDEVNIALSEHKKLMAQDVENKRQAALTYNARMKSQAEEQRKREESERRAKAEEEWNRKSFAERAFLTLLGLIFLILSFVGLFYLIPEILSGSILGRALLQFWDH